MFKSRSAQAAEHIESAELDERFANTYRDQNDPAAQAARARAAQSRQAAAELDRR